MTDLLHNAYLQSIAYQQSLNDRPVFPSKEALDNLNAFDENLPQHPQDVEETLNLLDAYGSPATVASTGGKYFGFVTGGALPVSHAANWLATTWDQNGAMVTTSPIVAKLERIVQNWLIDLFHLPQNTVAAFVTGATMANFTALAAARHAILKRQGWDVEADGLFGAPEVTVIISAEIHVSVLKALSMLGFGRERVIRAPVDSQGRIDLAQLPPLDDRTLLCIQAGNVNSGAFDPALEICQRANEAGTWVHVDGAFGLWAQATESLSHLCEGINQADSWTTDAHKWLNVPYESGIAFCRHPEALIAAMSTHAAYLVMTEQREPSHYVPEFSRRARVVDTWAALRTLGKSGLGNMIERTCQFARRFADGLKQAGFTIHNDVNLNQVIVSFGDSETTKTVIHAIQQEGTLWAGQTLWQGHTAMRISVSSWATTEQDVEDSLQAIIQIAQQVINNR